ncbi:MAG: hypothetical protein AAF195_04795, partial [Pseudomonadota bacterium]
SPAIPPPIWKKPILCKNIQSLNPNVIIDYSYNAIDELTDIVIHHSSQINLASSLDAAKDATKDLTKKSVIHFALVKNIYYWRNIQNILLNNVTPDIAEKHDYLTNIIQQIESNNFKILPCQTYIDDSDDMKIFFENMRNMLPVEQGALTKVKQNLATEYFVIKFIPEDLPVTPVKLQSLTLKPTAAVNDIRVNFPFDALSTINGIRTEISYQGLKLHGKGDLDSKILLWHRPLLKMKDLATIKKILANNYLLIVDWDDWYEKWPEIIENKFINFKAFHAISTTHSALANELEKFNPNIKSFANHIYRLPDYRKPQLKDKFVIFFGAIGREEEVESLKESLQKLINQFKDKLHFEVIHAESFYQWLPTNHKNFTPICHYKQYNKILSKCDFCLLPLLDNQFNRMKSDLKFIESAANSVIAIASPVIYENSIDNEVTGFIYSTPDEIYEIVAKNINEIDIRQKITYNAYQYVKNQRMLADNFYGHYQWFMELYSQRELLNEQLHARLAEIGINLNDY